MLAMRRGRTRKGQDPTRPLKPQVKARTRNAHKVGCQRAALVPQRPKKCGAAPALQQQEGVEGLKDLDAGLVDGDDDGAAAVADVSDCAHHDRGGARIQAW